MKNPLILRSWRRFMNKFLYSLGLIALGLIVGQTIRYLVNKNTFKDPVMVSRYIKIIQNIALLGMIPFANMASFWIIRLTDARVIILPFLCAFQLILGGILGLVGSKILKLDKKKTGSMFICGSFSNLTSFGGLICFMFFGEPSYALVSMYIMSEQFTQYTYGFPIARLYGDKEEQDKQGKGTIAKIVRDPYIRIILSCIAVGLILNISGLERPVIFGHINSVLIPLSSFMLIVAVGFHMKFSVVGKYIKECLVMGSIKFLFTPLIMMTLAYLLGLGRIENGLPLKVVLVMSAMPPAFTALVPPQIYGLDVDLANSTWLFNTGALIVVLPVLYAIQVFLL